MPVHLDTHEADVALTPGTTKSDIVGFLYRHDEYGYSPQEVHDELEIPHNTAKVTLKRLYDEEYVDKTPDGYYHARPEREDLFRYTAALAGLDRMFADHDTDSKVADADPSDQHAQPEPAPLDDEAVEEAVDMIDAVVDEDGQ